MRWIFFTLLFANCAALAWGMVVTSNPSSVSTKSKKLLKIGDNVASIQLLSEDDGSQGVLEFASQGNEGYISEEKQGQSSSSIGDGLSVAKAGVSEGGLVDVNKNSNAKPSGGNNSGKKMCEMIGPFASREDAKILVERLGSVDVVSEVKNLDLPAGKRYQVFLPPESSKDAAFRRLSELQANGVDSYVIRKGPMANSISLGLFRRKSFAESHVNHLKTLGLEPQIDILEDTVREIWVFLQQGEERKMSDLTWDAIMEELNNVEKRQNFCLDVASGDNFH